MAKEEKSEIPTEIIEQDHKFHVANQRAMSSDVCYKVKNDDDYNKSYMMASTHMSSTNGKYKDFLSYTCFEKSYDWYITQRSFKDFESTLKTICCDEDKRYIITEKIDYSLHAWLEMKLLGDKPNKKIAVKAYCDSNDSNTWWKVIEQDFKDIFGPVVRGLRALHKENKYHGNLLNGVAIKQLPSHTKKKRKKGEQLKLKLRGILFNMVRNSEKCSTDNFESHSLEDIADLNRLIRWVLMYPFLRQTPHPILNFVEDCEALCLLQLRSRLENSWSSDSRQGTWTLNLALIWEKWEIITLMRSLQRLIAEKKHTELDLESCFTPNWIGRVENSGNDLMIKVLNNSYTDEGFQKLRFWRNCLEHMEVEMDEMDDITKIDEAVHEIVLEVLPELFREALPAYHKYMIEFEPKKKKTPDEHQQQTPNMVGGSKQKTTLNKTAPAKKPRTRT